MVTFGYQFLLDKVMPFPYTPFHFINHCLTNYSHPKQPLSVRRGLLGIRWFEIGSCVCGTNLIKCMSLCF